MTTPAFEKKRQEKRWIVTRNGSLIFDDTSFKRAYDEYVKQMISSTGTTDTVLIARVIDVKNIIYPV